MSICDGSLGQSTVDREHLLHCLLLLSNTVRARVSLYRLGHSESSIVSCSASSASKSTKVVSADHFKWHVWQHFRSSGPNQSEHEIGARIIEQCDQHKSHARPTVRRIDLESTKDLDQTTMDQLSKRVPSSTTERKLAQHSSLDSRSTDRLWR